MNSLEVQCPRCERRFRVRPEFAGRTTRCPGCSASIPIVGPAGRPAPRKEADEPPPLRRVKRDDEEQSAIPALDWQPVIKSLGRERVAVMFVWVQMVTTVMAFAVGRTLAFMDREESVILIFLALGPAVVTAVVAVAARVSATGAPKECQAGASAWASLLCCGAALLSLVVFLYAEYAEATRRSGRSDLPIAVSLVGLILAFGGTVVNYFLFLAQVATYRRSRAFSRGAQGMAKTVAVVVLFLLGIGYGYTFATTVSTTLQPSGPDHEVFSVITFLVLLPVGTVVVSIAYFRFLGTIRQALLGEAIERE